MECPITFRPATFADADVVAALHADSWRRHYRGALADDFLDHEVEVERQVVWRERLAHPGPKARTILVERGAELVGFAHVVLDDDATWGALLDNLHVRYDVKRQGLGALLVREVARWVVEESSNGLYLWVLEQNESAQAFYSALGGVCVGREPRSPEPGDKLRFHWPAPLSIG